MKKELGFGYCGLCCALCSDNENCKGCKKGDCKDKETCKNYTCCQKKGYMYCSECDDFPCQDSILSKKRIAAFCHMLSVFKEEQIMDMLQENEKRGILYHRTNLLGDYDGFDTEVAMRIRYFSNLDKQNLLQKYPVIEDARYELRLMQEQDRKGCYISGQMIKKQTQTCIGSVEISDFCSHATLDSSVQLNLFLNDEFETKRVIYDILTLLLPVLYVVYPAYCIVTRISPQDIERREAFEMLGFTLRNENSTDEQQTVLYFEWKM